VLGDEKPEEDGVDIRVVCEILMHSSIQVTRRYAHLSSKNVREAVERLSQFRPASGAGNETNCVSYKRLILKGILVGAAGFEPATPAV